MVKRKHASRNAGSRKKNTTSLAENVNRRAVVEQTSPAMKVNVDEWEEIFDYTSLKDLLSMAQTCKRMQMIAGWYFKTYYPNEQAVLHGRNVLINCLEMNGFYSYITDLSFHGATIDDFRFIAMNNFNSLRSIRLFNTFISRRTTEPIKDILGQVEYIKLICCRNRDNLYANFLKFCTKLRTLKIIGRLTSDSNDGIGNDWLFHEYPTLENIGINMLNATAPSDGLISFLERNPNLKSLSLNGKIFNTHWRLFMGTNSKLDNFRIHSYVEGTLDRFQTELNALYDRGFYKRLSLERRYNIRDSSPLSSLQGLEELYLLYGIRNEITTSLKLTTLHVRFNSISNFEVAAKHMIGVKKIITHGITTSDELLQMISHLPALKEIECEKYTDEFVDLPVLNEIRASSKSARKFTIFVEEKVYLATKWKFGHEEFNFVTIKRINERVLPPFDIFD